MGGNQKVSDEINFPSGNKVFLSDIRILNPALDCNPNETLLVGLPMPGIRQVKTGNTGVKQIPDIVLCVLSSKKFNPATKQFEDGAELFECTPEEFSRRGWFARTPATELLQRWEAAKIREVLDGKAPTVNLYDIYQTINRTWSYYMDFEKNPKSDVFITLWTMATYFFFLFRFFPYVKFGGLRGVGKSKAGSVANGLCFNASIFSGATESSIFRLSADTRGTQIIDEQERLSSEEMSAYIQVLNSGFQADGYAIRTNKDSLKVERWPSYSPKMICSIAGLRETLDDRSIEIIVYMSGDQEIKSREPPGSDADEWKPLRNDLYLLLLQQWQAVQQIYRGLTNDHGYTGRFWNITKPIIAIAKLVDAYAPEGKATVERDLVTFLSDILKSKHASGAGTNSARVAYALKRVLEELHVQEKAPDDYSYRVTIRDVIENGVKEEGEWFREEFQPKGVARMLANLHLYREPIRRKYGWTFEASSSEVRDVMQRYGFEENRDEHDERNEHGERKSDGVDRSKPEEGQPFETRSPGSSSSPSSPSSPSSSTTQTTINEQNEPRPNFQNIKNPDYLTDNHQGKPDQSKTSYEKADAMEVTDDDQPAAGATVIAAKVTRPVHHRYFFGCTSPSGSSVTHEVYALSEEDAWKLHEEKFPRHLDSKLVNVPEN